MKKKYLSVVAIIMNAVLAISASQICYLIMHQPKVPENLDKFSKIK